MSYVIKSIDYHKAQIADQAARNAARLDQDVSDVGLSSWAADQMISAHEAAIDALELGAAHGIDGPAAEATLLVAADTGEPIGAKLIEGKYGPVWLLNDAAAVIYGRTFVPTGKRSRVQRKLGLEERQVVVPAKRYLKPICYTVGSPMYFRPVPADQ